jgi:hypothetical protein
MSTQTAIPANQKKYQPYVPPNMEMREFTFRAVFLGLVMTGILGAANAYLGLKAGMTIAATYPAAVIGMSVLRLMKGSLLEENIARRSANRWLPVQYSPFRHSCSRDCGQPSEWEGTGNQWLSW